MHDVIGPMYPELEGLEPGIDWLARTPYGDVVCTFPPDKPGRVLYKGPPRAVKFLRNTIDTVTGHGGVTLSSERLEPEGLAFVDGHFIAIMEPRHDDPGRGNGHLMGKTVGD